MKIAVIVGSLRAESYNRKAAEYLVSVLPEGVEHEFLSVDVPLMNEDLESNVPESVMVQAEKARSADAILIVSPEYNRGVPGVLKNFLDWLSRPSTGEPLKGKPAALAGVSTGPIATAVMQSHIRSTLAHMNIVLMPAPAVMLTVNTLRVSAEGEILPPAQEFIQQYVHSFVDFANKFTD